MNLNENVQKLITKYCKATSQSKLSIGLLENGIAETTMFDRGHEIECSTSAIYEIGEITSVFTASIMQKMVCEGRISLNDSISDYLEELPKDRIYPHLNELATHTAGYPVMPKIFYWNAFVDSKININPYMYYTYNDMIAYLIKSPVKNQQDKCMASIFGIGVLGNALANAQKIDCETMLQDFVKKELALPNTTIDIDFRNMIIGYNQRGKKSPVWAYQAMLTAYGLKSNVSDMLEFLRMNMEEEKPYFAECHYPRANPTAKRKSNQNSITPHAFGYGWSINGNIVWKSGMTGGHRCFAGFDKVNKKAAVVMSNYRMEKGGVSAEKIGFELLK